MTQKIIFSFLISAASPTQTEVSNKAQLRLEDFIVPTKSPKKTNHVFLSNTVDQYYQPKTLFLAQGQKLDLLVRIIPDNLKAVIGSDSL